MKEDTAVRTCNANNTTFKKIQYLKYHMKEKNFLLQ